MNDQALQQFRSVCEREFQFLVDDFGFTSVPLPDGKHVSQFQSRLSNGNLTLVVCSTGYGMHARVCLEDKHGREVPLRCLAPGWELFPFAKPKKKRERDNLNLEQQISQAAQLLRDDGADILSGDIERFNKISDQINGPMR